MCFVFFSALSLVDQPSRLSVNGLHRPADLASAPFPVGDSLLLAWVPPSANMLETAAFTVKVWAAFGTQPNALNWSSGPLRSTDPWLHFPISPQLGPDTTYKWAVRYEDGLWSDVASFDTAPDPPLWGDAAWIGGASMLRTDWVLPAGRTVVRGRAYATGLGSMELHINGQRGMCFKGLRLKAYPTLALNSLTWVYAPQLATM